MPELIHTGPSCSTPARPPRRMRRGPACPPAPVAGCYKCGGNGRCTYCGGTGRLGTGRCFHCGGSGACETCRGTGR